MFCRCWLVSVFLVGCALADEPPLARAHAHNDYEHGRPLLDALGHGFTSVEADVHLRDGHLLVAHDAEAAKPERTLTKLYLQPLLERARQHGGKVFPGSDLPFYLLIDFKTAAEPTYAELNKVLIPYQEMLTSFEAEKVERRAVTIIISGNRPREIMAKEAVRWAGVDGRLADLQEPNKAAFMPWISDNWNLHFRWRGQGELAEEDRRKLAEVIQQTHARGQLLRFWGIPDKPATWKILREAGVDLINTDKLAELSAMLRSPAP